MTLTRCPHTCSMVSASLVSASHLTCHTHIHRKRVVRVHDSRGPQSQGSFERFYSMRITDRLVCAAVIQTLSATMPHVCMCPVFVVHGSLCRGGTVYSRHTLSRTLSSSVVVCGLAYRDLLCVSSPRGRADGQPSR